MNDASSRRESRHGLGRLGEDVAAAFLERQGIEIVARRFRRRGGEIDLIGRDTRSAFGGCREEFVFVEVKARSSLKLGRPESGISRVQKHRIRRTAEIYLSERGMTDVAARFDVISILFDGIEVRSLDYFADAFGWFEVRYPDTEDEMSW